MKTRGNERKTEYGGQKAEQVTHCDEIPQGVLLYTKAQMAAALQVSVRCVTGMMYRGDLNFLKINGHMVRFRPEEALKRLSERAGVCHGHSAVTSGQWPVISEATDQQGRTRT